MVVQEKNELYRLELKQNKSLNPFKRCSRNNIFFIFSFLSKMKVNFHHISFLLVVLAFSACSKNGCIQKTKYKQKNYKVKKLVAYQRGSSAGGSSALVGVNPGDVVEKKVEFKGKEIEITKDGYQFDEEILFVNQTDFFSNPKKAWEQLEDLSKLLIKEKDLHVTIIGNTASDEPTDGVIYGNSEAALGQISRLNLQGATIRDAMNARAKRVFKLLVDNGVNPSQLDYTIGTHRRTKKERVVSFRIKTK